MSQRTVRINDLMETRNAAVALKADFERLQPSAAGGLRTYHSEAVASMEAFVYELETDIAALGWDPFADDWRDGERPEDWNPPVGESEDPGGTG